MNSPLLEMHSGTPTVGGICKITNPHGLATMYEVVDMNLEGDRIVLAQTGRLEQGLIVLRRNRKGVYVNHRLPGAFIMFEDKQE